MTDKKYAARKPCGNCPYRVDAPVFHWHRGEFEKVLAAEDSQLGAVFQCHKQNGELCVGWLLDQRERNLPSIMLRLMLATGKDAEALSECIDEITDGGHELYPDIFSMCRANGVEKKP